MKKINKNYLNRYSRQIVLKNVGISGQKKISSSNSMIQQLNPENGDYFYQIDL